MTATPIDGKAIAEKLRAGLALAVKTTEAAHGFVPGLAVVLVGCLTQRANRICWRWSIVSTAIPLSMAFWYNCLCRRISMPTA
jgi:hypothetical protein